MMYKQLGTTDLNVSVIGLGTWQFCGERWSIGWCLKNEGIDSVLVGCKTPHQIKDITNVLENYVGTNQTI